MLLCFKKRDDLVDQAHRFFSVFSAKSSTMLAIKREDIKAEIERLEKALRDCSDSGIRRVIQEWIAGAKRRLLSEQESK